MYASSLLMERPSPVPPNFLLVDPSACWKASKISFCLSSGMPMPESLTVMPMISSAVFFKRSEKKRTPLDGLLMLSVI
jgi:hypothetical protein